MYTKINVSFLYPGAHFLGVIPHPWDGCSWLIPGVCPSPHNQHDSDDLRYNKCESCTVIFFNSKIDAFIKFT